MPEVCERIAYLQEKAGQLRRLSTEHAAAGNDPIARKLAEVALELDARAAELKRSRKH